LNVSHVSIYNWIKSYGKTDIAVGKVMTDHWKSYNEFIPHEKHICSKAQTYTVEG
jgi:IS1 family transposase